MAKKLALIASKGTLDWAYPPFILASTAAAWRFLARVAGPHHHPVGIPAVSRGAPGE